MLKMKTAFIIIITMLLAVSSSAQSRPDNLNTKPTEEGKALNGFRDAAWGMSMQDVKKVETANLESEDGDGLIYSGNVAGLDCYIIYSFTSDKLTLGYYSFSKKYSNDNNYIDDYDKVVDLLISKYGLPEKQDEIWRNDLFRDDPQRWGMAVSAGYLVYQSIWDLPKTEIMLKLYGNNYEINHVLFYKSVELRKLREEDRKKTNSEGL